MDPIDFFELCSSGDWDSVEKILQNGLVDINYQHKINGWTALHWASRHGHKTVVSVLLKYGADKDLKDAEGRKPVDVACNSYVAELLGGENLPPKFISHNPDFVPNYLRYPPFNPSKKIGQIWGMNSIGHNVNTDKSHSNIRTKLMFFGIAGIGTVLLALLIRNKLKITWK